MTTLNRRSFLSAACATAGSLAAYPPLADALSAGNKSSSTTKPIRGSWFEFQHHNTAEGVYWNPACAEFTCRQWDLKIREMAELGMEYAVLMATALYFKAYYETGIFPRHELGCDDPVGALLAAGDKYGVKVFMGGGFYGDWVSPDIVADPEARKKRLKAIEELTERYGHHKSFYGWYWPNEAFINKYYGDRFIDYVNECSALARSLTPDTKTLIAPYGTRVAVPDDNYVRQLEKLDIDIIAYQDEVGVEKSTPDETPAFYEGLRKAHDKVPEVALWADMEIFRFEGKVYRSALLPAPFERIERQIKSIAPFVDTILVYQYLGMMSKPGASSFAGHSDAAGLYNDYHTWLKKNHPDVIRKYD